MRLTPKALYRLLGVTGLVLAGILGVAFVTALAMGPPTSGLAPSAGLCAAFALFPGLAFLWMWSRAHAYDRGLAQVGALLESYGEVSVATMAKRLGRSEDDAEQLIALAIKEGHARGRIDPKDRVFRGSKGG